MNPIGKLRTQKPWERLLLSQQFACLRSVRGATIASFRRQSPCVGMKRTSRFMKAMALWFKMEEGKVPWNIQSRVSSEIWNQMGLQKHVFIWGKKQYWNFSLRLVVESDVCTENSYKCQSTQAQDHEIPSLEWTVATCSQDQGQGSPIDTDRTAAGDPSRGTEFQFPRSGNLYRYQSRWHHISC